MAPACVQPREIGYVKRTGIQEEKSWRTSRNHASTPIRGHRVGWESEASQSDLDPQAKLRKLFEAFAEEWKSDTWHISSVRKRISHPAYLKIIGMGKDALPFIFDDMRKEPSHWFWALEAITREDLAPNATSLTEVHDAWLEWGKSHGY